jgi:hypothetical protein
MDVRSSATGDVGWQVLRAAAQAAEGVLDGGLVAAYAIGSLAHGGFSVAASDIDLAVVSRFELTPGFSARVVAATANASPARLSVFHAPLAQFAAPPPSARFPALDRLDLLTHGILVFGREVRAVLGQAPRPDHIVAEAVSFAIDRLDPNRGRAILADPACASLRDITKLVLAPVRLLFVAQTATVASNDEAAAHYRATYGARHQALVDAAIGWRAAGSIEDWNTAAMLLEKRLQPLHREILGWLAASSDIPLRRQLAELAQAYRS